MERFII